MTRAWMTATVVVLGACGQPAADPAVDASVASEADASQPDASVCGTGGNHGTLTANIDGVAYSGTIDTAAYSSNVIAFGAEDSADTRFDVTINAPIAGQPSVGTVRLESSNPAGIWIAGTGTASISARAASIARGTFTATAAAEAGSGASGMKHVDAQFDICFW